jgi:SAM-dependent methyltransferase
MSRTPVGGHASIQDTWDALAPAYDLLTAAHDHGAWAAQLEELALAAGLRGERLLDVGCGTGCSSEAMVERGYDVVGVDVSPGMLEVAERRLGGAVPLLCHDMRELPEIGRFDIVWSVSDSVNFLVEDGDLIDAFTGFRRNLVPGGLVVFDVDTLASFRTLYTSLLVVPATDRVVIFNGLAQPGLTSGAVAEASIEYLEPTTPPWWRRVRAIHRQRHHTEAVLASALTAAGLDLVAVWGTDGAGGSDRPLDEERHNKAVYIARHPAPSEPRGGECE